MGADGRAGREVRTGAVGRQGAGDRFDNGYRQVIYGRKRQPCAGDSQNEIFEHRRDT